MQQEMVMATSNEGLGVDLRTRTKQLGAKEKSRRKKVRGEILARQENRTIQ